MIKILLQECSLQSGQAQASCTSGLTCCDAQCAASLGVPSIQVRCQKLLSKMGSCIAFPVGLMIMTCCTCHICSTASQPDALVHTKHLGDGQPWWSSYSGNLLQGQRFAMDTCASRCVSVCTFAAWPIGMGDRECSAAPHVRICARINMNRLS